MRVTDVTTPGMMWGDGSVRVGSLRYDIEFAVGERSFGQGAHLELRVRDANNWRRDDRFEGRSTNFVAFSNDPAVHPGSSRIDTVLFSGAGEWNGRSGYKYQMSIVDRGDVWHPSMRVKLTVTAPNGAVVANVDGTLVSGGCTLTRAFRASGDRDRRPIARLWVPRGARDFHTIPACSSLDPARLPLHPTVPASRLPLPPAQALRAAAAQAANLR